MAELNKTRGRPRNELNKSAILKAAIGLLESNELPNVTTEAIAERAKVSKSTIYRWWPNKSAVIMDAFLEIVAPQIRFESIGTPLERVIDQMKKVAQAYQSSPGKIFLSLIAQSQFDPELAKEFRAFSIDRRAIVKDALQQAIDIGELKENIDLEISLDALYAPIFYRLLVGYGTVDNAFVESVASHVFEGISKRKND